MSPQYTPDDIAAVRAEEGNLRSFIAAITANRPTLAAPPPPAAIGSAHGPGHKPGAWPSGTRSDQPTCHPDCDCAIHPALTARPAATPPAA